MALREHSIRLADDRTLCVLDGGDPGGVAVLVHHGTPGSADLYPPHVDDARSCGIRLLAYGPPRLRRVRIPDVHGWLCERLQEAAAEPARSAR